jgi:D-glycero-alpha-D-manno-heptose 1-phosphate guanylyltransferase
MKIKEAIILAGGFGTRLQSVLKDVPKVMADINGAPFISYLILFLAQNGIEHIILSLGFKSEAVKEHFDANPAKASLIYSVEEKPLGTGGAIKRASKYVKGEDVLILNGDTFFEIDLGKFCNAYESSGAEVMMALKKAPDCYRYDSVALDADHRVVNFTPRKAGREGIINGGMQIINKNILDDMPEIFSFENDFLMKRFDKIKISGCLFDSYFIDIGIPKDYEKAKEEFKKFKY